MRRTLSSRTTLFWNYVLPVLIWGGLSYWLLLCWLGKITDHDGRPLSIGILCLFTILGGAALAWFLSEFKSGFKHVEVDDDTLYVSNYLTEVRIPLSEITVVREGGGARSLTTVSIGLRKASAFGKNIEFVPRLRLSWSGNDVTVRELKALCKHASARNEVDQATPFDPTEKIFETGDDCLQVGKDYLLYGCEGKDEVCEKDKFFFRDLTRITVIRGKKSGTVKAIEYKVKRKSGTFEIGGYEPAEMEEIAHLLESRVQGLPIAFEVRQNIESRYVPVLILGVAALLGTTCSGWLLHFAWTVWRELGRGEALVLFVAICLPVLALTSVAWIGLWRIVRD